MNQLEIHLLDLPNEILIIILKKLDNIDVLYSLFGINNRRLHTLVQQDVFTNILNFIRISAITDSKLGRYWNNILSPVHDYDSTFQRIVKYQLTDLILHDNDEYLYSPLPSSELHQLKCFSLTCYNVTLHYDDSILPLRRRMTHLEKLILYLRVRKQAVFLDGTDLHNEILVHRPRLQTFIFYISTEIIFF
ncbi:unnamed protein product, partial [Rotaria magnacalcarata]